VTAQAGDYVGFIGTHGRLLTVSYNSVNPLTVGDAKNLGRIITALRSKANMKFEEE
jgi:hypothetical protein